MKRKVKIAYEQILSLRKRRASRNIFVTSWGPDLSHLIKRPFDTRLYHRQKSAWKPTQLLIYMCRLNIDIFWKKYCIESLGWRSIFISIYFSTRICTWFVICRSFIHLQLYLSPYKNYNNFSRSKNMIIFLKGSQENFLKTGFFCLFLVIIDF